MDKAERLREKIGKLAATFTPTIKECRDILAELDKPELDPTHKEILQSLMDEKGCVVRTDKHWWWQHRENNGVMCVSGVDCSAPDMIDLGVLGDIDLVSISHTVGMNHYAYVTKAGVEALRQ